MLIGIYMLVACFRGRPCLITWVAVLVRLQFKLSSADERAAASSALALGNTALRDPRADGSSNTLKQLTWLKTCVICIAYIPTLIGVMFLAVL